RAAGRAPIRCSPRHRARQFSLLQPWLILSCGHMKDHRKRSNTAEQGLEKVPRSLIRRHGDVSHAKARPCLGGTAAARGKLRVDHRHGRAYNGVMNPGQAARTVLSRPPTLRRPRKSKEIADIATRLRETRPDLDTPTDSDSVMQRARELIAASR